MTGLGGRWDTGVVNCPGSPARPGIPDKERNPEMISKALLIRWESQTDEDTMDTFLEDLSAEVTWERTTHAWFAIRYMRGEFGVFSVFNDEAGRVAHLEGKSAQKIFGEVNRLVMTPPKVFSGDILAYKMPALVPENATK